MYLDFELTDEDYEIARQNGISRNNAYQRFYVYGWEKERTITEPLTRRGKYRHLYKLAKMRGMNLTYQNIAGRKQLGWTDEESISYPPGTRLKRKMHPEYKYIKKAEKNGIQKKTYFSRRRRGWDKERASTEPVKTKHRRKIYE